ncbi:SUMF1/EgtB/PvdO family nonheme iron enzyme [Amycolatopsis sp. NPDC088138]|uniref:SUMF1/EgtB/PvdO family nonheme iron enzyme n=1 Tax=Amycolatopsis sp. NPDC088138 TaxID=3363938 RepID=UPI00380CB959
MTVPFDPLVPRPIDRPTPVRGLLSELDEAKILAAPDDPADRPAWRAKLHAWREDARARHGYTGEAYARPGAAWAATCYSVAQVWLWDELLYSFDDHRFTPERFLEDARERFGGLDAVVLWHAYPVIGLDDRNQWDFYRDVPGLKALVDDLHRAGLRVFVDYNPWDVGTRRGEDDLIELAALVADLDADGVFLDTLKKAEPEFVERLEAAKPGLVLEGESKLAVERIEDHAASWAQFFADSPVPGVLRAHWYERRHMQHHVRRWHRDHTEELQSAWLNGVGVMVWEVVFGVWVGWSRRDAATVRRMVTVQRAASDLLLNGDWTPLADLAPGLHASSWEQDGVTLWTIVNRGDTDYEGSLPGIDLLGGVPARGIGAALEVAEGATKPAWLHDLATPEHDPDARFPHRLATRVSPQRTTGEPEPDAVVVPQGPYVLTVRYRARETGMYQGAPYVDEWKPLPPRLHDARTLQREGELPTPVAVAVTEVTSAQFAEFVETTGYQPADPHRFLAHRGGRDEPVTYVDLGDARAYCAWRGGRLPTEDEWQLAGETGGLERGTPAVWNWTESEHSDGRTRFVMLKGGSDYRAEGSEWYVEGGRREPAYSVKLLLPGLGLARAATVGFRCAWDVTA